MRGTVEIIHADDVELRLVRFSPCQTYRYGLTVSWDAQRPLLQWIGLNPSTADESRDDPTLRRVKRYSREWGFGGVVMCNLYALRATDPRELTLALDPVGPLNGAPVLAAWQPGALELESWAMAAWGAHPLARERGREVAEAFARAGRDLRALALTRNGDPRHPLYVRADAKPRAWSWRDRRP